MRHERNSKKWLISYVMSKTTTSQECIARKPEKIIWTWQSVKVDKKQEYIDNNDRIEVERAFSLAKRRYGLGLITAKLDTANRSSIALSIIAMNVNRLMVVSFAQILVSLFSRYKLMHCTVKYMKNKSYRDLAICWADTSYDLLVIGDLGLMDLNLDKCRYLFEIIEARDCRKSTVIISQMPVANWYQLVGENTYADACLSRMTSKAYRLDFPGCDRRVESK